ncbi:hypothetical protein [Pyxidicoccus trucidator]|uniref:RCC1 domain-containing protein n=1 Tax=Pyxidicoccus trucidator TaxID=2709662 RepID=UPI001F085143|nr:hypothetical protein [Pyxidicoccus trucidator]
MALDIRRSLAVTEQDIVQNFTLKEVMDQLVAQGGVPGLTSLQLFRQLWDTQNPGPGLGLGGHCNDQVDSNNQPVFNGYRYECRPGEGAQAQTDPFTDPNSGNAYMAVGLFNRFDLAPVDGSECGEYRIVFAKRSGVTNGGNRNFIIFEAALPNPNPALGLEGCLPVARFWQGLSTNNDLASRAAALKKFYFQGLPGFSPVVHLNNYGADIARGTGQLRVNMFMGGNWLLREFKLRKTCDPTSCTELKAVIVTDKVNPFGGLFSPSSTHPLTADFRAFLPGQVAMLATPDINRFNYEVPDRFNGGQSLAQGSENNYNSQFGTGGTLKVAIQAELTRLGSPLTPEQIVQRAKALSCAGCHELSNSANVGTPQTWPRSLGFTHTSEFTESGPDGIRFRLSPALLTVFLPHRKSVNEEFLNRPHPCVSAACIAAGADHSLLVRPDGTVWAAGYNASGQLGNGTTISSASPVQVSSLSGITAVAAGANHSLALRSDGTVWAWGNNSAGQLGNGTTTGRSTPLQVQGLNGIVAVAAGSSYASGGNHSLALHSDGTVWAWGSNSEGQLGTGSTLNSAVPVRLSGLGGIVAVAAGHAHSLAVRSDGTVWAWGSNTSRQLGDGTSNSRLIPGQVAGLSGVKSASAGGYHSLAVRSDGTVWHWGSTFYFQTVENGSSGLTRSFPTQVSGLSGVAAVSAGAFHSLAVRSDGSVWSWGQNAKGQLGNGTRLGLANPTQVATPSGMVVVAAGGYHSLALRSDGTLSAWGSNTQGQRGDGVSNIPATAGPVSGLSGVLAASAGAFHSLALHSDGTLWAWGYNTFGQLGNGATGSRSLPVPVPGLSNVGSVSAGGYHSVALLYDGTVWSWGNNAHGQLGIGTSSRTSAVQVPGVSGIVALDAGEYHSLAVRYDGTVWSWGKNADGQLGDGTTSPRTTPVQVPGLSGIVAVSAGEGYSLALHYDGTVWGWGRNAVAQLGDGTTTLRTLPVQVLGLGDVVAVSAGQAHSLAMRYDGTVWAWGFNHVGEVGIASTIHTSPPVQVSGLSGIVSVAAGAKHSVAVRYDGTVWAWGNNAYGALGNGTAIHYSSVPVQVSGLGGAQAVTAGNAYLSQPFGLVVHGDGTMTSWGSNSDGQLGNGGPMLFATSPVRSLLN